jgi:ABC-type transport system substrate-binding protein
MMGVFNNLVLYDQHEPQNSLQSIRPDLATGWLWDEDRTRLTFHLRHGVKWHDGKQFTAADVKCTWDLLQGRASEKLRLNPRKPWYRNVQEVTAIGDDEVTFHLQRPQPALLGIAGVWLGAGLSVPCRSTRDAPAPDRHGPFQIRRIQAERGHPSDPQPGILEARPALP